jgi:hypothetical protein
MPEASDVPEAPESSNPAAGNQSVLIFYGGILYFPDPGVKYTLSSLFSLINSETTVNLPDSLH